MKLIYQYILDIFTFYQLLNKIPNLQGKFPNLCIPRNPIFNFPPFLKILNSVGTLTIKYSESQRIIAYAFCGFKLSSNSKKFVTSCRFAMASSMLSIVSPLAAVMSLYADDPAEYASKIYNIQPTLIHIVAICEKAKNSACTENLLLNFNPILCILHYM